MLMVTIQPLRVSVTLLVEEVTTILLEHMVQLQNSSLVTTTRIRIWKIHLHFKMLEELKVTEMTP